MADVAPRDTAEAGASDAGFDAAVDAPPLTVVCTDGTRMERVVLGSGSRSASPSFFLNHRGDTYFVAHLTLNERTLLRLHGGEAQRLAVPGDPRYLYLLQPVGAEELLYFVGVSTVEGYRNDLYRLEGERLERVPLSDGLDIGELAMLGETLFFTDNAHPDSLWRLHRDALVPERVGSWGSDTYSYLSRLSVVGDRLYFSAWDVPTGAEPWRVGAAGPAERVADLWPGPDSTQLGYWVAAGSSAFAIGRRGAASDTLFQLHAQGIVTAVADFDRSAEDVVKRWMLWEWNGALYYSGVEAGRTWHNGRVDGEGGHETWPERLTFTWVAPFDDQLVISTQAYDAAQRLWRTEPGEELTPFNDLRNRNVDNPRAYRGALYVTTTYDDRRDDEEGLPATYARFDPFGQLTLLRDVCPGAGELLGDESFGGLAETSDGRLILPVWDEELGSVLWLLGPGAGSEATVTP